MPDPINAGQSQVNAQGRDDLPDQQGAPAPEADRPGGDAARPSEVSRPRAQDADHLRAAASAGGGQSDPYETSGSPSSNRP